MLYIPSNNLVPQTLTHLKNLYQHSKLFISDFNKKIFNFCYLCHQLTDNKKCLCKACISDLPWIKNACYQCGIPLITHSFAICGQCQKSKSAYHHTLALFRYEQPIDYMIHALKFHEQLYFARLFSELLIEKILQDVEHLPKPDFIIPVPLHSQRLRERGFNQALEIAKPISRQFNIPLITNAIIRHRATISQSHIHAEERKKNMINAFKVDSDAINGKYLIILDDVMTTGATAQELANELQKKGAKRIDVWCCARTC